MIIEPAPAKINLALHVRHRRADGYHELETLFAFARHGDEIRVAPAERDEFTIIGPFAAALNAPSHSSGGGAADNLVTRAAARFVAHFGVAEAHRIILDKRLPIASGIGGGSADAAATLRALARLHQVALDDPGLVGIAEGLGADVPACLIGLTTFGTGKGESLQRIEGLSGMPLLLINPGVAVSTAAVFAGWDGIDRGGLPPGDLLARAQGGRNDLEPSARVLAPVIGEVRALLDGAPGLILGRMSGSGATCFGLFDTEMAVATVAQQARERGWWTLETTLA